MTFDEEMAEATNASRVDEEKRALEVHNMVRHQLRRERERKEHRATLVAKATACGEEANKLADWLRDDPRLFDFVIGIVQGRPKDQMGYAFRVNPPRESDLNKFEIDRLSISVPPDANDTYRTYEIAQFSGEPPASNCEGVQRFNDYESLVTALLALNTRESESEPAPEPEPEQDGCVIV